MNISRRVACLFLSAAVLACASSSPEDPRPIVVNTRPVGAELMLVDQNMVLTTPCHLPDSVDLDDEITISLEGYHGFQGQVRDLPQVAAGSYELVLKPKG